MKKILLVLGLLLFSSPSFAFQNYLVVSDYPLTEIKIVSENVVGVEMIQNPNCKGSTFLLMPKCAGATKISFCKGKKRIKLNVNVYDDITCIKHINGLKFIPLEVPVELRH